MCWGAEDKLGGPRLTTHPTVPYLRDAAPQLLCLRRHQKTAVESLPPPKKKPRFSHKKKEINRSRENPFPPPLPPPPTESPRDTMCVCVGGKVGERDDHCGAFTQYVQHTSADCTRFFLNTKLAQKSSTFVAFSLPLFFIYINAIQMLPPTTTTTTTPSFHSCLLLSVCVFAQAGATRGEGMQRRERERERKREREREAPVARRIVRRLIDLVPSPPPPPPPPPPPVPPFPPNRDGQKTQRNAHTRSPCPVHHHHHPHSNLLGCFFVGGIPFARPKRPPLPPPPGALSLDMNAKRPKVASPLPPPPTSVTFFLFPTLLPPFWGCVFVFSLSCSVCVCVWKMLR